MNYFFTKKFGIYFVATTKHNVSPSVVHEIIYRMMKVFRDYTGILNEESIRRNFVLIYEIIDEVIDYGHTQIVTTEQVKPLVVNEPIIVQELKSKEKKKSWKPKFFKSSTVASTAIQKTVANQQNTKGKKRKSQKNEIFVDIFEKLTVRKKPPYIVLDPIQL